MGATASHPVGEAVKMKGFSRLRRNDFSRVDRASLPTMVGSVLASVRPLRSVICAAVTLCAAATFCTTRCSSSAWLSSSAIVAWEAAINAWLSSRRRSRSLNSRRCWCTSRNPKITTTMTSNRIRAAMSWPRIVCGLANFIVDSIHLLQLNTKLRSGERARRELLLQVLGNLPPVEAAVLNEDLVRLVPGDDNAGQINPRHIAFQAGRIAGRAAKLTFNADSQRFQKLEIRPIPGERQNRLVRQHDGAVRRGQSNPVRIDAGHGAFEIRGDLAGFDPVLDIRLDPVFDVAVHRRPTVHQRDPRAVAPQFQGSDGSRVLAADHQRVESVVRVRILVVMANLGQILAGDAEQVRQVVIS